LGLRPSGIIDRGRDLLALCEALSTPKNCDGILTTQNQSIIQRPPHALQLPISVRDHDRRDRVRPSECVANSFEAGNVSFRLHVYDELLQKLKIGACPPRWLFGDAKGAIYGMAAGDLDGDGWPDIVVARSDAPCFVMFNHPAKGER